MAEERQPAAIKEGASEPKLAPTSTTAEDRKAAAALSSLDTHSHDDEGPEKKNFDSEALGAAMKNLSVEATGTVAESEPKKDTKKVVKVDAGVVALLVSELEISKAKATELLRAHDGDAVKAMATFVAATA